jgi:hypothetical protein
MGNSYDIIVNDFYEVDLSEIKFPLITIYENPFDYPGKFVARLFDMQIPTTCVVIGDTIGEVRKTIPNGMIRFGRYLEDDKAIVEVWL